MVPTYYLYPLGVSTRRMNELVETLGDRVAANSQVSVMSKEFDIVVEAFRTLIAEKATTRSSALSCSNFMGVTAICLGTCFGARPDQYARGSRRLCCAT